MSSMFFNGCIVQQMVVYMVCTIECYSEIKLNGLFILQQSGRISSYAEFKKIIIFLQGQ
jgi:hypothetical protein